MNGADVILPDIPRFYTALAEWLSCIICITGMKRRIHGWKLILSAIAALCIQSVFMTLTCDLESLAWMCAMAAAIGLMYLFLTVCCIARPKTIGYHCIHAFVSAEFAASLEWQIDCFFLLDTKRIWLHILCLVLVYGSVFFILWHLNRKTLAMTDDEPDVTGKELLSCIIIGLTVFFMSNLGFVSIRTPFTGQYTQEIFNVRTIIDLVGVAILYAYHVQRLELHVRRELEGMQNLFYNQYNQYQQSKETMELIDYKYHDLKHHILALRAETNDKKRKEYLDKMDVEIQNYEAQRRTGNQVLDTILTSKSFTCMKNDITLTSVVDGTLFDFMDAMDICSVFGNALDNAIECEKRIPDPEKRLIHISAFSQKSFLIMRFENYCEENIDLSSPLPATTKKDSRFHGYGLKSIRYIVKKYGGEVDLDTSDNWFTLKILIPMEIKE